jgi:hypothetical protein
MSEQLEEIKEQHRLSELDEVRPLDEFQIDWLISEVERLTKERNEFRKLYGGYVERFTNAVGEINLWHEKAKQLKSKYERMKVAHEDVNDPKPIDQWGEDYGDCLWWSFPIDEPPYCGTPLDYEFPDHVTHFTRFIVPQAEGKS